MSEASRKGRCVRDVRNGVEVGSTDVTYESIGYVRQYPVRAPSQLVDSLITASHLKDVCFHQVISFDEVSLRHLPARFGGEEGTPILLAH